MSCTDNKARHIQGETIMKSSPIYNKVSIAGRNNRDFGADADGFNQRILVGTSASNSHEFAEITVRRIELNDNKKEFIFFLDGEVIKRGILNGSDFEQVSP